MVRVIMGVKGTGKKKQMIDLINEAAKTEAGNGVHRARFQIDLRYS